MMSVSNNVMMLKRLTVAAVAVSLAAGGLLLLYVVLLNRHAKRVLQNVFELSQQHPPSFPFRP